MADSRLCSIPDCGKPHNSKGLCKKHYARFSKYGDPLFTKVTPGGYIQDFFETVVCTYEGDECLMWPYSVTPGGYASFWHGGRTNSVHRVLCAKVHGPPPLHHHAAHSCGNGHLGCVNKNHLSWKSVKENSKDKIVHGTQQRGQKNGNSKLTEADAMAIISAEGVPQNILAKQYGVTQALVSKIRRREMWKHLP